MKRWMLAASVLAVLCSAADAQFVFGPPQNLGSPINSAHIEVGPNLSADDLTLYFVSDRPGGHSGTPELWMSTRPTTQQPWGVPVNLGPAINSSPAASPSISSDELELYFDNGLRVRPGGQGSGDIWFARRERRSDPWGSPENLGPVVNGPFVESVPKLSRDGLSLYFASDRPGGWGNRDIWMTRREATFEPWEAPVNLGPEVNGTFSDWGPAISPNGLTLIFQSDRPGGLGGDDFWVTTRTSPSSSWGKAVHLGSEINTAGDEAKADFSADGGTLLFMSTRPGGVGSLDIWEIRISIR